MTLPLIRRRDVLRGGASLGALSLMAATGGCESILRHFRDRPVRHSVTSPAAAADVATYDGAVAAMKALPGSDPRAWANQAQIHFDFCPHGNWYFLPWHRAYLFYFEQICRELTGEDDFGLPFWNWTVDRAIPGPFWGGALNNPRTATPASMTSTASTGPSVIEGILDLTNFEQFASYAATALRGGGGAYGSLEQTPHNYVHGFVGGDMGGYHSPLDPVFWCHHNMIDCLWADWNIDRGNANTSDPDWVNFNLDGMFVDGNGNPAAVTCGVTVLMPILSYRFATSQKGLDLGFTIGPVADLRRFLERGGNVRFEPIDRAPASKGGRVSLRRPLAAELPEAGRLVAAAEAEGHRLVLQVGEVSMPSAVDAFVRVFVGKPDADAATPVEDPHYAGSFAFFHDPEAPMAVPVGHNVDVTDTVRGLRAAGELADGAPLSLRLVAVPIDAERQVAFDGLSVGRLDLALTRAATRGK